MNFKPINIIINTEEVPIIPEWFISIALETSNVGELSLCNNVERLWVLWHSAYIIAKGEIVKRKNKELDDKAQRELERVGGRMSKFLDTYMEAEQSECPRKKFLELKVDNAVMTIPISTVMRQRENLFKLIIAPYIPPTDKKENEDGTITYQYSDEEIKEFSQLSASFKESKSVYNVRMKALAIVMTFFEAAFETKNKMLKCFYMIAERFDLIESPSIKELKDKKNISPTALWNIQRGYVANYLKKVDDYFLTVDNEVDGYHHFYREFALPLLKYPPLAPPNQYFFQARLVGSFLINK